jgi:Ca2+-binding EF-hand superfamily protein
MGSTFGGDGEAWKSRFWECFFFTAFSTLAGMAWAAGTQTSAGDAALFDRLDANHNSVVAADEVSADKRALFDRLLRRGDTNHDNVLSRDEFLASLVPSRPEKPLEAKQSAELPQADAVRYVLLKMDTNGNGRIEKDEVPKDLQFVYEIMAERLDNNKNDALDRQELIRSGPGMSQVAARYVERQKIDVAKELAKMEKTQGKAVNRFEDPPQPLENLRDPQQARQTFAQLDANGDGQLESKEFPEPLQERMGRFMRMADRDGDGKLSEREFLAGTERLSRIMARVRPDQRPGRDEKPGREAKRGDSNPSGK